MKAQPDESLERYLRETREEGAAGRPPQRRQGRPPSREIHALQSEFLGLDAVAELIVLSLETLAVYVQRRRHWHLIPEPFARLHSVASSGAASTSRLEPPAQAEAR